MGLQSIAAILNPVRAEIGSVKDGDFAAEKLAEKEGRYLA